MLLTTKGRYAVMALVDMALQNRQNEQSDKATCLADISARQDITVPYLEQIFSKLKNAGLVSSVRGPGGGYVLSKNSGQIRISDVIDAVDETVKMVRCEAESHAGCLSTKAKCVTHDLWDSLEDYVEGYLNSISLEDVLNKKTKK